MSFTPEISVVIPVKNGAETIEACLDGILKQSLIKNCEIIVIDSGSSDDTLNLLEKYPVMIYQISPESFNHGLTRNFAVDLCRGEFIVMTVQDAIPANEMWLEELKCQFQLYDNVVGVCGKQIIPHHPDKNPVEWYKPISEGGAKVFSFSCEQEFERLSPAEQLAACSWDNVTAMYRKHILKKFPFSETSFGEDVMWAKTVLKKGFTLVYSNTAQVYHYHLEDYEYRVKRTIAALFLRYQLFNYEYSIPSFPIIAHLKNLRTVVKTNGLSLSVKVKWCVYNVRMLKANIYAKKVFCNCLGNSEKLNELFIKYCQSPPIPIRDARILNSSNSISRYLSYVRRFFSAQHI